MAKKTIIVKTDEKVKETAQKVAEELGLSLSDVVNAALRNLIRTREVYFSAAPRITPELEKLLDEVEADIEAGKNLSPVFTNAEDAIRWLNS